MNKMPFFSIIIPTFNSGLTLNRCLESILCQTMSDFEILIIDGVSRDNTLKILDNYNDFRIRIYSECDDGIYDAMNKGIKLAQGQWLYFLGSDDFLFDNTILLAIYDEIKKNKHKVVYGNVKILGDCGWAEDGDIYNGMFTLYKILNKNICHQAIFYHCSVFKKLGFYNIEYKVCADYDFNLKCYSKYDFLYVDTIISVFCGGSTSLTVKDNRFFNEKWKNIAEYFKWELYKKEYRPYLNYFKPYKNTDIIIKMQLMTIKYVNFLRKIKSKLI